MNYQKIYDDICKRGQERILPKNVYTEKHHIIPKCLGGNNRKENLTRLTAREHFIVHWILAEKLYPKNPKLWFAFARMFHVNNTNQDRYIPNSKIYEHIKMKISNIRKIKFSGVGNPRYGAIVTNETRDKIRHTQIGKKHTEETKRKISLGGKGRIVSPETRLKNSKANLAEKNSLFGKTHSEATKKKISEQQRGKVISVETKQKMSDAQKGKPNKHKVFDIKLNIMFESKRACCKYHNFSINHLTTQIKMGNFIVYN